MKTIPQRFRTSDGAEFESEAMAKRHQKAVDAYEAFDRARKAYYRALLETQTTADGEPFRLGRRHWIVRHYSTSAYVQEATIEPWHAIELDAFQPVLRITVQVETSKGPERTAYRICDLYADERKARLVCADRLDEIIRGLGEDVERLRK